MRTGWVTDRFGVELDGVGQLVELALRRNPKRAHLLVSTVLGKHIPTDPRVVHDAGLRLGQLVGAALTSPAGVVIGYAETATALGHCVAEALAADCLHSTRRRVASVDVAAGFDESHSHATGHLLLPEDVSLLRRPVPVVLVDDELSTGATALATIAELQRLCPREQYVLAALCDVRTPADRDRMQKLAAELGTRIDTVSLAQGSVRWPEDFPVLAADYVESMPEATIATGAGGTARRVGIDWPEGLREGGRHGFGPADGSALKHAAEDVARRVAAVPLGDRVLVLGSEELMYAPLLVACALAGSHDGTVRFSTTTRSPVLALDEPDYPIRSALAFASPEGDPATRFAYNVRDVDDIVLIVDDVADTDALRDGLLVQLAALARVHLVVLPSYRPVPSPLHGPGFGSYAADDVAWLLTDLSRVRLEAPIEEREEAIQAGRAHYAESLPVEYQPSVEYQALFETALRESAARVAYAVGVVSELVLDARGPSLVLASLARAGTPVGVLIRRWLRRFHSLDVPHYAVSIVRGRGIDEVALRYLASRHDPREVMFVDGWTGKGAIVRELAAALDGHRGFAADLAVLADPGHCVSIFGTREDYLVPSACLNSTVSGLVSRTVLNREVLAPGQFHGAKFYAQLAANDVSELFLDAVSGCFDDVAADVARDWRTVRDGDRTPTWTGWAAVEAIAAQYGIGEVNLVKPGVGETTRVLLRRVPWRVLVRPGAEADVRHVLLLADQRGVPVETVPGLAYSCVGLIRPL